MSNTNPNTTTVESTSMSILASIQKALAAFFGIAGLLAGLTATYYWIEFTALGGGTLTVYNALVATIISLLLWGATFLFLR